jgi:hypothetical protein
MTRRENVRLSLVSEMVSARAGGRRRIPDRTPSAVSPKVRAPLLSGLRSARGARIKAAATVVGALVGYHGVTLRALATADGEFQVPPTLRVVKYIRPIQEARGVEA